MSAVLLFVAMVCTPVLLFLGWAWADEWLADREDRRRREAQDREVDAEWLAVLAAAETTPIYDALACEQIERQEGWAN